MNEVNINDMHILEEITTKLKKIYNPKQIYLFGSYAWGVPNSKSDLDIAVIVEHSEEKTYKRVYAGVRALWELNIPIDLLVYTEREFNENASHPSTLQYQIRNRGKNLYEAV